MGMSRTYVDGDRNHIAIDWIKEWLDMTVMHNPVEPAEEGHAFVKHFGLPRHIKSIECSTGICAFTKCRLSDDSPEALYQ
ncbi:hypothetical protein FOA52_009006 [Chlamydomonas sp. UWO 241]|nr:hypothetical protein FOA52_009006 [Chlamydomonas sp. UWO 241]